jgi:hypothetical protein
VTAYTITATAAGGADNGIEMLLQVLTGATEAGGTSAQNGTSASSAATSSVTPAATSSLIVWSAYDSGTGGAAFTAAANNTLYTQGAGGFGEHYAFGHYSATVTGGTPVTAGAAGTNGDPLQWAIYEVLASGGSTPAVDASSPAVVTAPTGLVVTTASFTPPAGAVLAALVTLDGGGSSLPTLAMSDTGGALTWTVRAVNTTGNSGMAAVVTTTIPGGTPSTNANAGLAAGTGTAQPITTNTLTSGPNHAALSTDLGTPGYGAWATPQFAEGGP